MILFKTLRYLPLYLLPCVLLEADTIELSTNEIAENQQLMTPVGMLSVQGAEAGEWRFAINSDELKDGGFFMIVGNQLCSYASFDYEKKNSYEVEIVATRTEGEESLSQTFVVEINDLSGKWDSNGIVDAEVAAAYPEVNEGDYVIFNGTNGGLSVNFFQAIRYPNKILIKGGEYEEVRLTLSNVMGNSAEERVAITNFLGQVRASKFQCANGDYWRLSGRYDPDKGLGSRFYRGCDTNESTVDFGGSHGTYGIWVSNKWKNEGDILCYIQGNADGFEIDHMEISDGGFAGLMVKRDSGSDDMNEVYIHHMFIHDIGSEGLYLGSTQGDPQHQFAGLLIENCMFVRTGGEAIQAGQMREGSVIRNNVAWGAFDWMSPFMRFQDSVVQLGARQGNVTFEKNVAMGAAGNFVFIGNNGKSTITPNGEPIMIRENVFWGSRGFISSYQANTTDGVTPWQWTENYFGYFVYDYDRVYKATNRNYHIGVATPNSHITFKDNVYSPVKNLYAGQGSGTEYVLEDNLSEEPVAPVFMNLIGEDPGYPYLLWKRWSAKVGEDPGFDSLGTNKGQSITYVPGEVVQHFHNGKTRFYRCLESNTEHEPPETGDDVWELLIWNVKGRQSYYPPDDGRLEPDSFYGMMGVGLFEEEPIHVEPLIREWGGYPWLDTKGLVDSSSLLGWIHVELAPWVWNYAIESYLYVPEPAPDSVGAWVFLPGN